MSEVFDFSRFGRYFLYDNVQMWRRHSRAILTIGGLGMIFYLVYGAFSLVFQQAWSGPEMVFRAIFLGISFLALVFYQAKSYGYLTNKQVGSSWLMIPASTTEKFVSMLIIALVECPLALMLVAGGLDALAVAIDPTVEGTLVGSASGLITSLRDILAAAETEEMISLGMGTGGLMYHTYIQYCGGLLFFLLCGICFRRNKIAAGIGILFAISAVSTSLIGLSLPNIITELAMDEMDVEGAQTRINLLLNSGLVVNHIILIGLAAGIFFRIKNLKH